MRALWLEDRQIRFRDDVPRPVPGPGEARIRVRLAGICNTDLELVRGYYPFAGVPGHEFVGEVEEASSAPEWVGRRVVGEINAACGRCEACARGERTHCERRTVLGIKGRDGALAEHLVLPVQNLHAVPDAVPDDVAVFTEPLAAALRVTEQVPLSPELRVVVLGDGKLAQLVAQALAARCALLVIGRHPEKLGHLARRGIATSVGPPKGLRPADVVVECTGQPGGFALARQLVRPRGTIVLKSTYHGDTTLNLSSVVVDEVSLIGSRCGPFAPALGLLSAGSVDVASLVHARFPLVRAEDAFVEAARPGVLKVLVSLD
jgi:threonine dehydrogenase-like Zn-dependent dehydrogenase